MGNRGLSNTRCPLPTWLYWKKLDKKWAVPPEFCGMWGDFHPVPAVPAVLGSQVPSVYPAIYGIQRYANYHYCYYINRNMPIICKQLWPHSNLIWSDLRRFAKFYDVKRLRVSQIRLLCSVVGWSLVANRMVMGSISTQRNKLFSFPHFLSEAKYGVKFCHSIRSVWRKIEKTEYLLWEQKRETA